MLRPLRTLSTAGRDKLRQVIIECDNASGNYMGLNLPAFLETTDVFFVPFFADNVTEATYCRNTVKPLIVLAD
jgi:hypothetical protein